MKQVNESARIRANPRDSNGAALHALSFKMWHSLISSGLAQLNHEGLQLRRYYVLPHHLAMYIARQFTRASLQEIGREFGGRHYTTVLHSINRIDKIRRSDKTLDSVIARLMDAVIMQT